MLKVVKLIMSVVSQIWEQLTWTEAKGQKRFLASFVPKEFKAYVDAKDPKKKS